MADLNVEPRKKTSFLPWLLLALGVIALVVFLSKRGDEDTNNIGANTTDSSAPAAQDHTAAPVASGSRWDDVDRNAPAVTYDEIKSKNVSVRGTDNYAVYDITEDILFDKNQSTLRADASAHLKEISASINQRFGQGQIRLYGFTDAEGSSASNMELATARAEAVKNWLTTNGNVSSDRITVNAKGESDPKASNNTEEGKQENRRVQIVARKAA